MFPESRAKSECSHGQPALSGPSPSVNQAAAHSGQNGEQPPESEDDLELVNMGVKVLSPQNKDYHIIVYTLWHISRDVDSPEKLKAEIYKQCKDIVPSPQTMELGFFLHSKKWINNRLDINDM